MRLSKLPVTGEAYDEISPVLLLYKAADVDRVMHRFGHLVLERFDDNALNGQTVRAMCTRKSVEGAVDPGRHLCDYWPAFAQAIGAEKIESNDDFWQLLNIQPPERQRTTLAERASDVRRAVFQVLRAAQSPVIMDVRDGRSLIKAISEKTGNVSTLQQLILELSLRPELHDTPLARKELPLLLHKHLDNLLPSGMSIETFKALSIFAQPANSTAASESPKECFVTHTNRELLISLGTVASMKGETHLASLVLESYGGKSRKFDLEIALPSIAGLGTDLGKLSPSQQIQLRSVYVAMSRPTRFLCLGNL